MQYTFDRYICFLYNLTTNDILVTIPIIMGLVTASLGFLAACIFTGSIVKYRIPGKDKPFTIGLNVIIFSISALLMIITISHIFYMSFLIWNTAIFIPIVTIILIVIVAKIIGQFITKNDKKKLADSVADRNENSFCSIKLEDDEELPCESCQVCEEFCNGYDKCIELEDK